MKLDIKNLKVIRKKQKLTIQELAHKLGIGRNALSAWENGIRIPSEAKIRMLARILNVEADKISDLEPEAPISSAQFSETIKSWLLLATTNGQKQEEEINTLVSGINFIKKKLTDSKIIIDALLSSTSIMFYIKDQNQKYITANGAFLINSSLPPTQGVLNKTDGFFFPVREAEINFEQDKEVILSAKPIINMEGYIFGSRKKKWGLISKIPILDSNKEIAGLVGTFVDITERKREEGIRKLLEENIELIPDAVGIYDVTNQKLVFTNKAIEKITGYSTDDFYKRDIDLWLNTCIHSEDRKTTETLFENVHVIENIRRIVRPDGEIRTIAARIHPKKKYNNNEYVVTILKDITEQNSKQKTAIS